MTKLASITQIIINAINDCDKQTIQNTIKNASNDECQLILQQLNFEGFFQDNPLFAKKYRKWSKTQLIEQCHEFALTIAIRNVRDFEFMINQRYLRLESYITGIGFSEIFDFYQGNLPNYLTQYIIRSIHYDEKEGRTARFITLWQMYKLGLIEYDEPYFMRCLLAFSQFEKVSANETADFLLKNPDALALIYKMTQYELKVLDLSKWFSQGEFICTRLTYFGDEIFALMQQQGYVFDRVWIGDLLQSLTLPWKKPHLEWHCRVINFLQPTNDELLGYQDILFDNLASPIPSIVKNNIDWIERIYQDARFDLQGFQDGIIHSFVLEKQSKTLLKALNILTFTFDKQSPDISYREHLALLLMQSDMKLQTQVATILVKYFNDDAKDNGLADVILPYQDYFNTKTQAVFEPILEKVLSNKPVLEEPKDDSLLPNKPLNIADLTPIVIPQTWHDVLFMIGDCIREPSAQTIDVFLEGVNQLQGKFPSDFAKQLKPYLKSLDKWWENSPIQILRAFLICFSQKRVLSVDSKYKFDYPEFYQIDKSVNKEYLWQFDFVRAKNNIPFLAQQAERVLKRTVHKDKPFLPLLATPTHAPFYIDANILADRILQYQNANVELDLDELVVACNRLVRSSIDDKTKQKAEQFTGKYQNALQYAFDIHDNIAKDELDDDRLPLWTQISRLKHPDTTFEIFVNTSAKDILGVVKPYYIDYGERTHTYHQGTKDEVSYTGFQYDYNPIVQNRAEIIKDFNGLSLPINKTAPLHLFYHTAITRTIYLADLPYQIGLNPFYLNAILCRHISPHPMYNEAQEIKEMTFLIKFIIENQLNIQHSGWLFIGACLLFEKKPVQEMGGDFIVNAIINGKNADDLAYLRDYIADMIITYTTPINRLFAFLDRTDNPPGVIAFKYQIIERCLDKIDPTKPPKGYKKLLAYQQEFAERLK